MEADAQLLQQARCRYERARFKRALLGALPLLALVVLSLLFSTRPVSTLMVAAGLMSTAVALLWFGHGFPRAALMGVAAGTLPLSLVLCSARVGHACAGPWCMQLCFTTSAIGGAAAGLLIGSWAFGKRVRLPLLGTAVGTGLLTGAMGSTCAGFTGLAFLAVGLIVGVAVQWVRSEVLA